MHHTSRGGVRLNHSFMSIIWSGENVLPTVHSAQTTLLAKCSFATFFSHFARNETDYTAILCGRRERKILSEENVGAKRKYDNFQY